MEEKFTYNDVSLIPARISGVSSRSEVNPLDQNSRLPIFASPMDTVIGSDNIESWNRRIYTIMPRTFSLEERLAHDGWVAVSLKEFQENYQKLRKVLIDIANGHMKILYDTIKEAKEENPSLIVMAGNIANPSTYEIAKEAGVDYVRAGIGGGRGCITSSNTGIHYPMASLVYELDQERLRLGGGPYIVADGGIRGYSDIVKALALGADYVMIGSMLTKCLDSAAPVEIDENDGWKPLSNERLVYKGDGQFLMSRSIGEPVLNEPVRVRKKFYGMASKEGQQAMNGEVTKTSEGISMYLPVEYTFNSWAKNVEDYLRSAMSYCGCRNLADFIGIPSWIRLSTESKSVINK